MLMNIQHAKDNVDLDYFKCNAIEIVDISLLSVNTDLHTAHKSQLCFTANNVYNINHIDTLYFLSFVCCMKIRSLSIGRVSRVKCRG